MDEDKLDQNMDRYSGSITARDADIFFHCASYLNMNEGERR